MPQSLRLNDFSGGWSPANNEKNGAPNQLLQMDNVELDENGSLSLVGGNISQANLGVTAYEIYSAVIGGVRNDFCACTDGTVKYANGSTVTLLLSGGDNNNTAFSTAYDFVLICSGNQKKKTNISTTYNLGVYTPQTQPTLQYGAAEYTDTLYSPTYSTQDWSTVKPSSTAIVNAIMANMDPSEPWQGEGISALQFDDGPPQFGSSLHLSVGTGSVGGSYGAICTFPSPINMSSGSDNIDDDIFSYWIKEDMNVITSMYILLTDVAGNKVTYAYGAGYFP